MIETFEYEECCRASSHTDFNGAVVNHEYDSMKREKKEATRRVVDRLGV